MDDEMTQFAVPEGRITRNNDVFQMEYFLKDHLGSIRVTIVKNGSGQAEVKQADHYYPFGMRYESTGYSYVSGAENNYLYNGKELQRSLNWYDYGARFYDPVIGRWGVIDPMAEKYESFSQYNYTLNNPAVNIDPDGRSVSSFSSENAILALLGWAKGEAALECETCPKEEEKEGGRSAEKKPEKKAEPVEMDKIGKDKNNGDPHQYIGEQKKSIFYE